MGIKRGFRRQRSIYEEGFIRFFRLQLEKRTANLLIVILHDDDPEAKESFQKECQITQKPIFKFACFEKENKMRDGKSEKAMTKKDQEKRKAINKIITKKGRNFFAKHSHIVGIGISQICYW